MMNPVPIHSTGSVRRDSCSNPAFKHSRPTEQKFVLERKFTSIELAVVLSESVAGVDSTFICKFNLEKSET